MPSIILAGVAVGSQIYSASQQATLARQQRNAAENLKLRDTTPGALVEALAQGRQNAASARMPGMSQQENNISQQVGNTSQAAIRAGASSTQVQAALVGADARGQSALADLGTRAQVYRDQSQQRLTGLLGQQAQQQQLDQQEFSREKAALTEGSIRNNYDASQSVSNGVAGAVNILGSRYGGNGSLTSNPAQNGAIDAMATSQPVLGPTGLANTPPPAQVGYYNPIGRSPRMAFQSPFSYGRY